MHPDDPTPDPRNEPADPPAAEALPERESPVGSERADSDVEVAADGVERESPAEDDDGAGVESPPAGADRAQLLP